MSLGRYFHFMRLHASLYLWNTNQHELRGEQGHAPNIIVLVLWLTHRFEFHSTQGRLAEAERTATRRGWPEQGL